jgi:nitrogen-specific signal transduction histidine kinase
MSPAVGLQLQENVASGEFFGHVAHELRQPLSNIESIAYYLTLVLPRNDEKVQEQLARIRQLVEQSNWILSSGLRLAAPTPPAPEPVDFEELITEVVSFASSHVNLRLEFAGDLPLLRLDQRQGRELVETLLMLVRPLATDASPAVLRTSRSGAGALLEVLAPSEAALGAGSELCIESARQIAQAHGGTVECDLLSECNAPSAGFHVRVMLP